MFYASEKAYLIFEEFHKLCFKDIQLKIGSKLYTPLRKVCAFSDEELKYKFFGETVQGEKWTHLILQLKQDVEAKVGFHFNYVPASLYETD